MATTKRNKTAKSKRPAKSAAPKKAKLQAKSAPAKKPQSSKTARVTHSPAAKKTSSPKVSKVSKTAAKNGTAAQKDLNKKTVNTAPVNAHNKIAHKTQADDKAVSASTPRHAHFSKSDLDQFKTDLLAMRDRITGQSGAMRNAALQRDDEVNPEEDGTDAFMRLQTLEQVSSQQQILANINAALRAIEKGSYGVCDICGELINKPRLAVLPFAKYCIKCQSEMERPGRSNYR